MKKLMALTVERVNFGHAIGGKWPSASHPRAVRATIENSDARHEEPRPGGPPGTGVNLSDFQLTNDDV